MLKGNKHTNTHKYTNALQTTAHVLHIHTHRKYTNAYAQLLTVHTKHIKCTNTIHTIRHNYTRIHKPARAHTHIRITTHSIQGVPRVKVTTSGERSLGQTIPI